MGGLNSASDGRLEPLGSAPPGHFLSEELRSDTERFLGDVKRLVRRRQAVEREGAEPQLEPTDAPD